MKWSLFKKLITKNTVNLNNKTIDELESMIEELRDKECHHCVGNGCDDCRDCDVSKKKCEIRKIIKKKKNF